MIEASALSHLTNSAIVVYFLQWLKGTARYQRFASAMPIANAKVHVAMSAIGAFAAAIGMHGTLKGNSLAGWQATLAIPPLWLLLHGIWDVAQQVALNQIIFAVAVKERAAAPVVTALVTPSVSVTAPIPDRSPSIKETP